VVQIVDPAEETFPYWGRIEFIEPEDGRRITAGRAENWRADYTSQIAQHRAAIRNETDRLGWSFAIHRTDRSASELLLALHARIGAGSAQDYSSRGLHRDLQQGLQQDLQQGLRRSAISPSTVSA
jgi:hypothetical protein